MRMNRKWSQVVQLPTALLDTLFPPTDEQLLVQRADRASAQRCFRPERVGHFQALTSYQDPLVCALITENKFHHNTKAARLLAGLLDTWLKRFLEPLIIIPVPLGSRRRRERGHNQVETIVRHSRHGHCLATNYLTRRDETLPQSSLPKAKRIQNVADAFACKIPLPELNPETTVILLDDVLTTGATMAAARAALAPHLPPHTILRCLALAH